MKSVIINEKDNVGVSLDGSENIPAGHKYALRDIPKDEYVIKYGEIIGRATADIAKGEWVHTHNVKSHLDESVEYTYDFHAETLKQAQATFRGFKRAQGRAGIRNEIYIIPTVGCVNNVCIRLANEAKQYVKGSLDGIYALTHQFGCSQLGEDNENIKKLLCAVALNPNASYVLFVGLGCENNGMDGIKEYLAPYNRTNIAYFNCQEVEDEHAYGMSILKDFAEKASALQREEVDFSELLEGDVGACIKDCLAKAVSPAIFCDLVFFNGGEYITGVFDWEKLTFNSNTPVRSSGTFIGVYIDKDYINDYILTTTSANKNRVSESDKK